MTSINKWRVYCSTEASYQYWFLSAESTPTTCPNNPAHTLSGSISVVETINQNNVTIVQEATPTGAHYRYMTEAFDALASTITTYTFSFPIPVNLLEASFVSAEENRGDSWSWIVAKDTVVGALTASVSVSDTVLNVSPTVVAYLSTGFEVTLSDGVNTDELGMVLSIGASTITVEKGATYAFSAASPTYVKMNIYFCKDMEFANPWLYEFGSSKIQSTHVPAGTVVTVMYTNNSILSKRIVVYMEVMY